jgi:hypothetical protein
MTKRNGKPRCLTCTRKATYCGLCNRCRQNAYRLIREKKTDQEKAELRKQMERKGLILPSRRGRPKSAYRQLAEEALSRRK